MGFFKRDKESKNEKSGENNELKPELVEMVIDGIRVSPRGNVSVTNETIPPDIPRQLIPSLQDEVHVLVFKEKKGNRYLPIWIHAYESASITVKLQGIHMPRPLTYDFICGIIDMLGARVIMVIINELENDCFYAKMVLDWDGKEKEIDCRPSDAVNVAVRLGAPIFANEEVLKKASLTDV